MIRIVHMAISLLMGTAWGCLEAQAIRSEPPRVLVGVRYEATRANSPPGSCGCFFVQGGALDAALPLGHHWSAALEAAGGHANFVPGTARQLSTITLLAGPRYTFPLSVRSAIFTQAIFGAVRGFDADFRRSTDIADTATGFAYALGGAFEFRLSQNVLARPAQVDFIQTNLPNGADGRQRDLRFGVGLAFHVTLGIPRR